MKIAILGWGSLIWNPGDLEIDKAEGKNGWFDDGPMLPIEFARISKDKRLTLVIEPEVKQVQTLYSISKFARLDHAVLDLAIREGTSRERIGYYIKYDGSFYSQFKIKSIIEDWINHKADIDVAIWTDLSNNFEEKYKKDINVTHVISFLKSLKWDEKLKAEQYIRRTPERIETEFREAIENELGWTKITIQNEEK